MPGAGRGLRAAGRRRRVGRNPGQGAGGRRAAWEGGCPGRGFGAQALPDQAFRQAEPRGDGRDRLARLGQLREGRHLVGGVHDDAHEILVARDLAGLAIVGTDQAGHGMVGVDHAVLDQRPDGLAAPSVGGHRIALGSRLSPRLAGRGRLPRSGILVGSVAPSSIAAVTFTEFAASELLIRVRAFVSALAAGDIPVELRAALPDGLSEEQRGNLARADAALDEMTCSTIHGFCQRLITPYPVEADIDPGAAVMDRDQAELAFTEIGDNWLREELADEEGGLLAELVLHDPDATIALIRTVLEHLRRHREFAPYELQDLDRLAAGFRETVGGFAVFLDEAEAEEPETAVIAGRFQELAGGVAAALPVDTPATLVALLVMAPHPDLCAGTGAFRSYRKKGKWGAAARRAGLAKADAERLNDAASTHYALCCATWSAFQQAVATHVLAGLVPLVEPVMDLFREHKRAAALLDFDDLIFSARDLLRDHDEVRRALAARFRHVLVDEFQDTDPLQTEIFWRLCGDPPGDGDVTDWTAFALRPGALFLVGDPKQAIYRFRGADIAAYVRARDAFRAGAADAVLSIATNFRSCAPIMEYVNARFETALSEENGQPGFQALDPFRPPRDGGPSVAALDVAVTLMGIPRSFTGWRGRRPSRQPHGIHSCS